MIYVFLALHFLMRLRTEKKESLWIKNVKGEVTL